ncbi:hypothetical protein CSA17_02060 [bacterium DOLJORAL78_65_58]|nr:MAG: hypothetical protein CSA17_02060 [bacterium DOLJORAL78_65_58]
MNPNVELPRALVITHGEIAREMTHVVEMILGPVKGLEAMTNNGKSTDDITRTVGAWLEEPGPACVFIDDFGGSCAAGQHGVPGTGAQDHPEKP